MVAQGELAYSHKDPREREVMRRLRRSFVFSETPLFRQIDSKLILDRVMSLSTLDQEAITKDREALCQRLLEGQRYVDDHYLLLGHLILTARQRIKKNFDPEKEIHNINSIADLLVGNTKEAPTSKGKSSVIAPVFLLFESLWQSRQAVILTLPNKTLINEAITNYEPFRRQFIANLNEPIKEKVTEKTKWVKLKTPQPKKSKDLIESLTQEPDGLSKVLFSGTQTIFQAHSSTAFTLAEESRPPIQPRVLIDEMHQMANEQFISTSRSNHEKVAVTKEKWQNSPLSSDIASFVLSKLIYYRLRENGRNFFLQGNALNLSEVGASAINQLYQELYQNDKKLNQTLKSIINRFVLPGLKFDPSKKADIIKMIVEATDMFWVRSIPRSFYEDGVYSENPQFDWMLSKAEDITLIMGGLKPGQSYLTQKNRPMVREPGRGITLPSHSYNISTESLLRVVDDKLKYQYRPATERLRYSMSFPTWLVHAAKGQVQGLSANLFTNDLYTGESRKSQLASIIETFTKGKVVPSSEGEKERLPLPNPKIFKSQETLLNFLPNPHRLGKRFSQEMIICYNDFFAQQILERFSDPTIGLIISTTPEPEVRRILKRFANGEIKKIITSGRAGYGVNIKAKDGSYPDFHITIVNPETQTDINQGFGRLRRKKKKENFSILLTQDFLEDLSTLFHEEKPNFFANTKSEFDKALTDYKKGKNKDIFLRLFYRLLDINEQKSNRDYLFQTQLELAFQEKIVPRVKALKKAIIRNLANDQNSFIYQMLERSLPKSTDKNFIKSKVSEELGELLSYPEERLWEIFFTDSTFMRLQSPTQDESIIIKQVIDRTYANLFGENAWIEKEVDPNAPYSLYYKDLFQDNNYLKQEIPIDFWKTRVKYYQEMSDLISKQLPFDQIDFDRIDSISVNPLPPFIVHMDQPKSLVNDSSRFVKIDEDKYLVVIKRKNEKKQELYIWNGKYPPTTKNITVHGVSIPVFTDILTKPQPGSEQNRKMFFVFPTMADTDKIVTHSIVVNYLAG